MNCENYNINSSSRKKLNQKLFNFKFQYKPGYKTTTENMNW